MKISTNLPFHICFLLLVCWGGAIVAQETTDSLAVEIPKEKKVHYVIFPSYDYRPVLEHSVALLGKGIFSLKDNNTLVSGVTGVKSLSNSSYIINLSNEYYSKNWRYNAVGYLVNREAKMSAKEMEFPVDGQFPLIVKLWSAQVEAKRKLADKLFAGFGVILINFNTNLKFSHLQVPGMIDAEVHNFLSQPRIVAEYDTRDNVVYPSKGVHITATFNFVTDALGCHIENLTQSGLVESKNYLYTRNFIDAKHYYSFSGDWRSILVTRLNVRAATGDIPVGLWENANSYVRGYTEGNFTGKQLYHFDAEWRKYVVGRFGFVLFGTAGFVGINAKHAFTSERFIPAVGTGLRYQVIKARKVAFRADYAFGRNGENSLYIGLSEYF